MISRFEILPQLRAARRICDKHKPFFVILELCVDRNSRFQREIFPCAGVLNNKFTSAVGRIRTPFEGTVFHKRDPVVLEIVGFQVIVANAGSDNQAD